MRYPFLSESWIAALEQLRPLAPAVPPEIRDITVNLIVRDGPDGDVTAHVRNGVVDRGMIDDAPTTVSVTYDVAKELIVKANPNMLMVAIMAGHVTVQGDALNLAILQSAFTLTTAEQVAFHRKVQALTS